MTKELAWKILIGQLNDVGERMNELVEEQLDENEDLSGALFRLRIVADELAEQEIQEWSNYFSWEGRKPLFLAPLLEHCTLRWGLCQKILVLIFRIQEE